jgi:hypothetical protein
VPRKIRQPCFLSSLQDLESGLFARNSLLIVFGHFKQKLYIHRLEAISHAYLHTYDFLLAKVEMMINFAFFTAHICEQEQLRLKSGIHVV